MNIHQLRPHCEYFSFYPYYLPSAYCVTNYVDKKPSFPPENEIIVPHEQINKPSNQFIVILTVILIVLIMLIVLGISFV